MAFLDYASKDGSWPLWLDVHNDRFLPSKEQNSKPNRTLNVRLSLSQFS